MSMCVKPILTRAQSAKLQCLFCVFIDFCFGHFYFIVLIEALRQERPPHLRGDHMHPAMIERGRAIPNTQSVPIISDKPARSQDHVTIIDGRVSSFV